MAPELPKAYEPKNTEDRIYQTWDKSGYFNPDQLPGDRPEAFSIAMPPPNATGILHIGHAVMVALEDIMTRFERMRGKRTLWLPGTDHAAIATQNVVEKELKDEGKTKHDLGRVEFLNRVDTFVSSKRGQIKEQITRLGASCDWSRERFTLDPGMTLSVNETFKLLYEDGLIYRGMRVVNWCPRCQSTLADDEIEYKEQNTKLYTFKYDQSFPIAISTTRPETKFGDTGVAVNQSDERYQKYIGQSFEIDLDGVKRTIKIVADRAVDPKFGTGALGVTPAHSAIDEAIAQREHLPSTKVIDENAQMTSEAGGEYTGLYVKQARKKLVEHLRTQGLLEKEEDIAHNLSICYRCSTPIEPLPSRQWFVAVDRPTQRLDGKTLKQRALEVVDKNEIAFVPERYTKVYRQWMENLHDWCISRQIWYGHNIPVWYCETCHDDPKKVAAGKYYWLVTGQIPEKCPSCGSNDIHQDHDTLDTWFSSALWTFSTLGWPKKTKDLKTFHPTSVMETGHDIIFFWVARMILMSAYLVNQIPFETVYLHGLIRDTKGRKMSKSLGNGIDPLEMADKYGADAVRLSLVIGTTPGNDQKLDEQKIASYRNYVNKVWNVGRFIAMQSEGKDVSEPKVVTLADQWIISRTQQLVNDITSRLEKFEFSQAGEKIYDFAWHELADWYLEITKIEGNVALARDVFKTVLILLHPFMPFVTEELWALLKCGDSQLIIEPWPVVESSATSESTEKEFTALQNTVIEYRRQRQERNIPAGQPMEVTKPKDLPDEQIAIIERLSRVKITE
ncbi:MAG: valine--tRNA ligase [Patescibacteria group bacterium]|jgi:valyl-tRNA synthetase